MKIYQHVSRNRKFWMAMLTLLCMVTFVLCTGLGQGGLEDRILWLFGRRSGEVIARIDGTSYYRSEIDALRGQRNLANDFMRKSVEVCVRNLSEKIDELQKSEKADKAAAQQLVQLRGLRDDLHQRLKSPRYFETGVKLDDLVEFLMWRNQADRLNIKLVTEHVNSMYFEELNWRQTEFGPSHAASVRAFEIRRSHHGATDADVVDALRDEFRVRLAKLALAEAQPLDFSLRREEEQKKVKFFLPHEVRAPLSPHQMWQTYRDKRAEYDIALIPVEVESLLKKVPEPTQADLAGLFKDGQRRVYDPASPTPGFQRPHQVKVEWLAGDVDSKYYRGLARAVHLLEQTLATPWTGGVPGLGLAARPAAWQASLQQNYEYLRQRPQLRDHYQAPPLTSTAVVPVLTGHMNKFTPQSVAAMVGAGARPDVFVAASPLEAFTAVAAAYRGSAYAAKKDEIDALAAEELRRRVPVYAQAVAAGASHSPLVPAALWSAASGPQILPLGAVRAELTESLEKVFASRLISKNMQAVKKRLDETAVKGRKAAFQKVVDGLAKQYHLERGGSAEPVDRYSLAKAKGLEPMRASYQKYHELINRIESRETPERKLDENDFARLFFAGEAFAPSSPFVAMPWPPEVTEVQPGGQLFQDPNNPPQTTLMLWKEAEKPFLFWKSDEKQIATPQELAEVRGEVERAWRTLKAREKLALPKAKEIAENLQKTGGLFGAAVTEEAAKLGTRPIYLRNVSPLVPASVQEGFHGISTKYFEYRLPPDVRGQIEHPREDMAKAVVALTELKEPIKIGEGEKKEPLDEINKQLFELGQKLAKEGAGKQVQILTNRPQTAFYVAVVLNAPDVNFERFADAYRRAVGFNEDQFVQSAQEEAARRYREALVDQMRQAMNVWVDPERRKEYEQEGS